MIDKQKISHFCRILGVHVAASTSDLKYARNTLAKLYHPDKYGSANEETQKIMKEKFQLVQSAYEFLLEHHSLIQEEFKHLKEYSLTSRGHRVDRSHWVYSTVQAL